MKVLRLLCGITPLLLVLATGASNVHATISLTGGAGASNVMQVGLDTESPPTARASVAPVFPGTFAVVEGSNINVLATSALTPDYNWAFINDDTGFNFQSDSVTGSGIGGTNRGWIPFTTGTEIVTFSFVSPLNGLAGIDFLTLFVSRTAGTYQFQYSTDNQNSWLDLATVGNDDFNEVFRMGFSFDQLSGVTDVRMITNASDDELFIGEVDFLVAPPEPVPTLTEWGIIFLIVLLAGAAVYHVRKLQPAPVG